MKKSRQFKFILLWSAFLSLELVFVVISTLEQTKNVFHSSALALFFIALIIVFVQDEHEEREEREHGF